MFLLKKKKQINKMKRVVDKYVSHFSQIFGHVHFFFLFSSLLGNASCTKNKDVAEGKN